MWLQPEKTYIYMQLIGKPDLALTLGNVATPSLLKDKQNLFMFWHTLVRPCSFDPGKDEH